MKQTEFDFSVSASKAAKTEGMDRVARGANPQWVLAMHMHAVAICKTMWQFTADDVFLRAAIEGPAVETHDRRAFGPIMLALSRAGYCRKANRPSIGSARRSKHNGPMQVWQSLIYTGQA